MAKNQPVVKLGMLLGVPLLTFVLGWGIGQSSATQGYTIDNVVKQLQPDGTTKEISLDSLLSNTPDIDQPDTFDADFYTFWEVYRRLQKFHPDAGIVSDKDYLYGAVKGLANSVGDPFTYFLTPDETNEFINVDLNGELQGIGAELSENEAGIIEIVKVIPGAPAEDAGLLPGDLIIRVDGEDVIQSNLYEVVDKIRGEKGTSVTLTIARDGEDEPLEITITRDEIKVPSVEYELIDSNKIGHIILHKFSESTGAELQQVANTILLSPPEALVLDLRDNSGGYLEASVDVVSLFVETGKVVTVKNSKEDRPTEYFARGRARLANLPLVVLVNEQSASAAEIVAGALQDLDRAQIIGMPTYGKGSVQELDTLPDGSSLRLTIAKWYMPSGRNVEDEIEGNHGVIPDSSIARTPQDRLDKRDPQMDEALKYLSTEVLSLR